MVFPSRVHDVKKGVGATVSYPNEVSGPGVRVSGQAWCAGALTRLNRSVADNSFFRNTTYGLLIYSTRGGHYREA